MNAQVQTSDDADSYTEAELSTLAAIESAETAYREACEDRDNAKRKIKSLKDDLKDLEEICMAALDELRIARGDERDGSRSRGEDAPRRKYTAPPVGEEGSDLWRDEPITVLPLDTIKGFGAKKIDALKEKVGTVGGLEDLRAEAAERRVGLQTLLPDGIGRKAADDLEALQVAWLDANVFATGATEHVPVTPVDDEPAEIYHGDFIGDSGERVSEMELPPGTTIRMQSDFPAREELDAAAAAGPAEVFDAINPTDPTEIESADSADPDQTDLYGEQEDEPESGDDGDDSDDDEEDGDENWAADIGPEESETEPAEPARDEIADCYAAIQADYAADRPLIPDDRDTYEDGREAADRGWTIADCNWTDAPRMRSWLIGFHARTVSAG